MRIDEVMLLVFRSMRCDAVRLVTVQSPSASAARITWRLNADRGILGSTLERRISAWALPNDPVGRPLFDPVLGPSAARTDGMITMVTARSTERLTYVTLEATAYFDEVDCSLAALLLSQLPHPSGLMYPRPTPPSAVLTIRQIEILRHIRDGLTADAAARRCNISTRTVHKHLEQIYRKLNCHDKITAVLAAERAGLLKPSAPPAELRDSA
jgi:DNA-binding CsgD family transcriptional regulator